MIELPALTGNKRQPRPGYRTAAVLGLERWNDAISVLEDRALAKTAGALMASKPVGLLLEAVFGSSPFLTRCLLQDIGSAVDPLKAGPQKIFARTIAEMRTNAAAAEGENTLMRILRVARRRIALIVALADIAGVWPVTRVTQALSDFAEATLDASLGFLLRQAASAFPAGAAPQLEASGYIVLGMGKLGGCELNYSSDIDLIVLFDEDRLAGSVPEDLSQLYIRLTRDLVRILESRTGDGHVFRTDLRLRPDPGATPPALSVLAAETYYESLGQNWERAAMIKARPVAGDREAGAAFLKRMAPFIWRKHLDFAAIADIHSIKRQIHAHRGGGEIAIAGHDVKLGRGGIREIEFFAQTQQLIWGGRNRGLRARGTCETLRALAGAGRISEQAAEEMSESYEFLRRLEHRLQMVDDQQTHKLPSDDAGFAAIAGFMGFEDERDFAETLEGTLRTVERHYAHLFEEAPALGASGNLVFTGGEHDPDTLATLTKLGFSEPERVSNIVRGWHRGRTKATRSQRSREILTELMPVLIEALSSTSDPDAAFLKFDEFLIAQPAGVQLFSLLHANPGLLDLVAEIMGSAPGLAARLGANPSLFEAVVSEGFYDPLPERKMLAVELGDLLADAPLFEDILDQVRRWTYDRRFQAGIQFFRDQIGAKESGAALSNIAETALTALQPAVENDFAERHGRITGGGMAIVALGKLGGSEMTMTSDLDLIFLYEVSEGAEQSDGKRPLSPGHYFTRLSQAMLNAITALTAEGRLYEVDMRLRPSGNAGPLATNFAGFAKYQETEAWTWEQMALSRARVIAGPPELCDKVAEAIGHSLCRRRDPAKLVADVAEMRARIDKEHKTELLWRVKHRRGGVVDLEFITQYLQLRHAADHRDVLSANTGQALRNLTAAGCLDPGDAQILTEAAQFWAGLQAMLRLTSGEGFDEASASQGLRAVLARAAGADDFEDLKRSIVRTSDAVHAQYRSLIGERAANLAAAEADGSEGG
ncbi:MAG: bifunctional [glutamine synthetase] adenylyltransferase/[glutamine synthetase]-adenylyl-L-tyrosine phosphorylase [Alphaproteobacteria bacterium]|nr:bifunctional [glutamine synthetase] adenylyltransferase/[glutamine synthetase]-adenylyl-L-tyrosine phosphorylase [Alphaproteobacteria bacterium]